MAYMHARAGILFLLVTAACAGSSSSGTSQAGPEAAPPDAESAAGLPVVVDNQNINDVNIYLIRGGGRVLVGRARSGKKSTIVIPESVTPASSNITLVADPPGGSGPITAGPIVVPSGQRLYWKIGSSQESSTTSTGN